MIAYAGCLRLETGGPKSSPVTARWPLDSLTAP
jgi:hypothetical protein